MKNQNVLLTAALLVLGAASCQKEEEVVTQFTAGMEQSSAKTTLGADSYFYWESTDVVKVYSDASNAGSDFTVAPRSDNGTWAVLSGSITAGGSYTAIYPASIAASASSVTLPAVQTSADGSLVGFPMYAVSSTAEFQFKNLCGALRIHLEQANCTISSIKVTAGSAINGTYAVSVTNGIPVLGACTGGTNTTTLTLGTAQPIGEGHDFYVQIPAGEYSGMQLTFYQPDGSCCTKSGNVTVERSVCSPIAISGGLEFPNPCLSGAFSVSATQTVRFASGNLQYNSDGGVWSFSEHQYDYGGYFGWGTGSNPTLTSFSWSDYASFDNWGDHIAGDWRTLSWMEWRYLRYYRADAANKYATGRIDMGDCTYINGCIFLPDTWSLPIGCSFSAGVSSSFSDYSRNTYTLSQWSQMEAAGAVFLPAAGYRNGMDMGYVGEMGYYWSSDPDTYHASQAYGMNFSGSDVYDFANNRYNGQSVRLVWDNKGTEGLGERSAEAQFE